MSVALQRRVCGTVSACGQVRIRSATWTFVLIVFTYLASNVLNIVITVWEQIDFEVLVDRYCLFYLLSTDVVSLLTIVAGALRLLPLQR